MFVVWWVPGFSATEASRVKLVIPSLSLLPAKGKCHLQMSEEDRIQCSVATLGEWPTAHDQATYTFSPTQAIKKILIIQWC